MLAVTVVRVVLAGASYLAGEGVARVLESDPSLELVGVASDLDGLLKLVDESRPHVLVTDIRMPPGFDDEGIRAAAILRDSHPSVGVVVLSQHDEPEYALRTTTPTDGWLSRSEEHTSELQSHLNLVCRLLLEKKKSQPVKDDGDR